MRHLLNTMRHLIHMANTREKKTCLLFPAAKVNTPKAMTTNACNHPNHPSKTSCHTSCHLRTQKVTHKITSETNNEVENATPARKSVSLQLFVEDDTKRLFANRTCSFSMLPLI